MDTHKKSGLGMDWNVFFRGKELNESQQKAYHFLEEKRVEEIFNFLIEHLLVNTPGEPFKFLTSLLDKCMTFRDQQRDPLLLFDRPHQESIYKALDPGMMGSITYSQYCAGMRTVGLENFETQPVMDKNGMIKKKIFLDEMDRRLIENLYSMLGGLPSDKSLDRMARSTSLISGKPGTIDDLDLDESFNRSSHGSVTSTIMEETENLGSKSMFLERMSQSLRKMTSETEESSNIVDVEDERSGDRGKDDYKMEGDLSQMSSYSGDVRSFGTEETKKSGEVESVASVESSKFEELENYRIEDTMPGRLENVSQQSSSNSATEEANKDYKMRMVISPENSRFEEPLNHQTEDTMEDGGLEIVSEPKISNTEQAESTRTEELKEDCEKRESIVQ